MNSVTQNSSSGSPNARMKMSADARTRMLLTEKVMLRYYNDMGKKSGNCTWGPGFLAHKGICSAEELARKVSQSSVDVEFEKRLNEVERRLKLKVRVPLSQAQFDGLASFVYNTGVKAQEPVFNALNRNDFAGAAAHMSNMTRVAIGTGKSRKMVTASGLIRRRAEESEPFRMVH